MRHQHFRTCLSFVFSLFAVSLAAQEFYEADQLNRYFQQVAESYVIETDEADPIALQLRQQPLLVWNNAEREQLHGAMYVWEHRGLPYVLGSIFTYQHDGGHTSCRHEMLSLADAPLVATFDSKLVWSPKKSALHWQTFDHAPEPSENPRQRLAQMRLLARKFSGQLSITGKQPSQLRLLPQPLLQFQGMGDEGTAGAIFSFAVATDAEILLVIQTQRLPNGSQVYAYAAAPGHYHELELRKGDQTVWNSPTQIILESTLAGQRPWSEKPFFIFTPEQPLPPPSEIR